MIVRMNSTALPLSDLRERLTLWVLRAIAYVLEALGADQNADLRNAIARLERAARGYAILHALQNAPRCRGQSAARVRRLLHRLLRVRGNVDARCAAARALIENPGAVAAKLLKALRRGPHGGRKPRRERNASRLHAPFRALATLLDSS